jgi:hypothetical protein
MQWKINCAGREARHGGDANHQMVRIRIIRNRITLCRDSEGFILLFEDSGQHNPRPREGTLLCLTLLKDGGSGDC